MIFPHAEPTGFSRNDDTMMALCMCWSFICYGAGHLWNDLIHHFRVNPENGSRTSCIRGERDKKSSPRSPAAALLTFFEMCCRLLFCFCVVIIVSVVNTQFYFVPPQSPNWVFTLWCYDGGKKVFVQPEKSKPIHLLGNTSYSRRPMRNNKRRWKIQQMHKYSWPQWWPTLLEFLP